MFHAISRQMPYRHVIWDWNGTLLNDVWLCVEVLNDLLARHQLPAINPEAYREDFGFPVINFYERLGFQLQGDTFHHLSHSYITAYDSRREECTLHPQARDVIELLRDHGIRQSVLSAYKQDTLESILERFDLCQYFDHIAGQDNIYAAGKIQRGQELMELIGQPPKEVVLIGDTEHDLEVAHAIGVDCILLEHGHYSPSRLARLGAAVCPNLESLAQQILPPRNYHRDV